MKVQYLWFLIGCTLLISHAVKAQQENCRPRATPLLQLKTAIDSGRNYKNAMEGHRWADRKFILEAACAVGEKDKNLVRKRVGLMWQQLSAEPIAHNQQIFLKNVLSYAIAKHYQPLLLAAANAWQLDLNYVDSANKTCLDHLDDEIKSTPKAATKKMLMEYREIFESRGALRYSDISFRMQAIAKNYDRIKPLAYGYFPVQKSGKWGWVNKKDEVIIPLQYQAIRYFLQDLFEVSNDGVHYFFVNRHNQKVKGPWDK